MSYAWLKRYIDFKFAITQRHTENKEGSRERGGGGGGAGRDGSNREGGGGGGGGGNCTF